MGMVRALWGGLRGIARAVLAPHFYTYRLTCISSMTAARMDTTLVCRGVALCAPLDIVGSTHRASPDDLPQRPRALSDHMRSPGRGKGA